MHQLTGVAVSIALTAVSTFIILKVIAIFTPLRVPEEEDITGLDISTHAEPAYNYEESLKELSLEK